MTLPYAYLTIYDSGNTPTRLREEHLLHDNKGWLMSIKMCVSFMTTCAVISLVIITLFISHVIPQKLNYIFSLRISFSAAAPQLHIPAKGERAHMPLLYFIMNCTNCSAQSSEPPGCLSRFQDSAEMLIFYIFSSKLFF